jgi:hypothetical protein
MIFKKYLILIPNQQLAHLAPSTDGGIDIAAGLDLYDFIALI